MNTGVWLGVFSDPNYAPADGARDVMVFASLEHARTWFEFAVTGWSPRVLTATGDVAPACGMPGLSQESELLVTWHSTSPDYSGGAWTGPAEKLLADLGGVTGRRLFLGPRGGIRVERF